VSQEAWTPPPEPPDDRPAYGPGSLERDLEYQADWDQGGDPE
jgi:hypothetical protein